MNQLSFIQKLKNKIKVSGKNNKILVEHQIKISKTKIVIKGDNNTLHVKEGAKINGSFLEIVGDNCTIIIGKNSIIGEGCYLSAKEKNITLTIGNDCMLSRNAKLMTSDGHPIFQDGKIINSAKDITLGTKVWIADDVVILKGVEIGSNSVVGISSVLTKSIPKNSIAVGNPAKIVKEDISWAH
ncbi:MAG: hexapeptide transferase [Sulfurimonas sp. RIFOXYD12_FULL_33_39]|uniref:acyltransferase n=1 Tax=unclassified Sulfurimonas TaxID=2623549 RepID=UPI0008D6559C|nr:MULTISPECIES: acyltransferase [unclassified Sulfurimonas]OHE03399.1 MAG: hexapeptide transferase [Sulfurimonas sp. RIFCSPLOWO2_12_FULL_34_6]OHE09065.1 MAG: hexapeptide transferase [Sulfurimonas sp. RIFOXYD12_FULL_33_39]OHE14382.1 MAG: hexapeptide transferase [Sulfurimonas sp. RIFOXYD2_FULL_34_21]